jgi:CRP-like cAMP-binding protein
LALEDDIRILRAAPLLSDIPIDGLRLLAFSAETRALGTDEVLFRAGDEAGGGFVLVSGTLTLQTGTREPVRVDKPSRLIEELALFCEVTRSSTAKAERTRLLQLPRPAFMRMLNEYPQAAAKLHERLAQRLRSDAAELGEIAALLDGLGKR